MKNLFLMVAIAASFIFTGNAIACNRSFVRNVCYSPVRQIRVIQHERVPVRNSIIEYAEVPNLQIRTQRVHGQNFSRVVVDNGFRRNVAIQRRGLNRQFVKVQRFNNFHNQNVVVQKQVVVRRPNFVRGQPIRNAFRAIFTPRRAIRQVIIRR